MTLIDADKFALLRRHDGHDITLRTKSPGFLSSRGYAELRCKTCKGNGAPDAILTMEQIG